MQALLDQGGYDMPQRGDIREGTVISVSPQEVIIDLGLKREAVVPASDLSRLDKEMLAEIQEGTTWPVYILQPSDREGNLLVSLSRALQEKDWLVAQQAMDNNEMIEAVVSSYNAGGLEVIFGDLRGFVPASHLSSLPRELSPDEIHVFDPLPKLALGKLPMMVLHGAADTMISPTEGQRAHDALTTESRYLYFVPDRGHNDISQSPVYWDALRKYVAIVT